MQPYTNRAGTSPIVAFDITDDSVSVKYRDGDVYVYTVASAGARHIREMKRLARLGEGLSSYISRHVRDAYESKSG